MLYPLKFKPIFKDKIWGGRKIKTLLGMDYGELPNCGEVWLVSGYDAEQSVVTNGFLEGNELNELVEVYMGELVGEKIFARFGNEFPLLVKIIDSNDWLSIQVHPDDELARKRNLDHGKTEMWYVLEADPDARLISGFNQDVEVNTYQEYLKGQTIKDLLNIVHVEKDDVFFIPAGRVHALGPGCLLAEIQQTSDTTYRLYDWDRIDAAGMKRELHTEEALAAIDFKKTSDCKTQYETELNKTTSLVASPHFVSRLIYADQPVLKNIIELDSFVIYMVVEGACSLKYEEGKIGMKLGETVLIPAAMGNIVIEPDGKLKLLEIFIDAARI
ncbi:MAG: mannose-6-phosphate isomerase [Marinilabiliales bacterium]|nr:MAG: mannose-6-phosphate isomerase [Marinilabiliales bacterium]